MGMWAVAMDSSVVWAEGAGRVPGYGKEGLRKLGQWEEWDPSGRRAERAEGAAVAMGRSL